MNIKWKTSPKAIICQFLCLAAGSLAGCGRNPLLVDEALSGKNSYINASNMSTHLEVNMPQYQGTLTSNLSLLQTVADNQQGWLVLSWDSPQAGAALLSFRQSVLQDVSLSLQRGRGAVVISPSLAVLTAGQVQGTSRYTCGPQGATCETPLPHTTDGDLTYPCGPQGATCRISIPQ